MSASADKAQSLGFLILASSRLFFTQVKHMSRSICVKPTFSSAPKRRGKSCIMHSSRVGDLNLLLSASAHFGFTNSGTIPPVFSRHRAISGSLKISTLMFPGYGEKPVASATSPPVGVSFRRASSWLYSTLMVISVPFAASSSLQIPPTASPGSRGTATEFIAKLFFADTPKIAQRPLKGRGFVSWNSSNHSRPSSAHFLGRLCWCNSACTSP
mmetsp:Transcript_64074/g.139375  ORF Transcript_64074/g.139375 Transcript_64074/m.139375 type:complete len:213 (+) Transcript_64074:526-1164(+)